MGAKSRNKGAAFECEVARLLDLNLGWKVMRNLQQYQVKGQGDLNGQAGVMIECKRYVTATDAQIGKWWSESLEQAKALPETAPVLIFKADRQPIKAVVPWGLVYADAGDQMADTPITLTMDQFYELARELL